MQLSTQPIARIAALIAGISLANAVAQAAAPASPQGIITYRTYAGDVRAGIRAGTAGADGVFYPKRMEGPYNGYPGEDPGDDDTRPVDVRDSYSSELVGYFYPPKTGKIQFAISTDDPGELWFSTDDNPANKVKVANEPTWNGKRSFGAEARRSRVSDGTLPADRLENQSAFINVVAGKPYWIQSISNEGGGGDNNAVAFRYDGDPDFADGDLPILGKYLSTIDRSDLKAAYLSSFNGAANGFTAKVHDGSGAGAASLDSASVKAELDGASVTPTVTKGDGEVSVAVSAPIMAAGSTHTAKISGKDTAGNAISITKEFTVPAYTLVKKAIKVTPDTSKPGFLWRVFENSANQDNSNAKSENAIAGLLKDGDGNPLANNADPAAQGAASGAGKKLGAADNALIEFELTKVLNVSQQEGDNNGHFTPDEQMPGIPSTDGSTDGIAAEVITFIELPAGVTTMAVNSDDGFKTGIGESGDLFNPPVVAGEFNGGRGASDTVFTIVAEEAGVYPFRTTWEEGGGGANIEWFTVKADGTRVLVNDTANGGLKAFRARTATGQKARGIAASPALNSGGVAYDAAVSLQLEDGENAVASASIKLSINGTPVNATVTKSGKVNTISYKPATPWAAKTKYNVSVTYADGSATITREWYFITLNTDLLAYWDFNDASDPKKTFDKVGKYVGEFEKGAGFTADGKGRSGKAGDRAAHIGAADAGSGALDGTINVTTFDFLSSGTAQNRLAVSFWQRLDETKNESQFWIDGVGQDRTFQAHAPWGGGTIYFDTAGCCGGDTRISSAGDDSMWNGWHHFVFQKEVDHKQIWVDGKLFLEGDNSGVMASQIRSFHIGSDGGGGNNVHGDMDDFAVFATALTPAEIAELFKGTSPDKVRAPGTPTPPATGAKFTKIAKNADGTVTLEWTGGGTLQAATSITGPWGDVAGAKSPYTFKPDQAATFGRIKQ